MYRSEILSSFWPALPIKGRYAAVMHMLTIEILQMELPFGRLQELTVEWFAKQSLAPLDPTPLEHLLRSSIYTFETKLFRSIASLLNAKTKASIDTLLMIEDLNVTKINNSNVKDAEFCFAPLKTDAGRIGLDKRLQVIEQ